MYVIGLTGNIATGKSTVAGMLRHLGAFVLDADGIAHQLMLPETEIYGRIVARFGRAIVAEDGTIDRAALGEIVFADPEALSDLEQIVHPGVVSETLSLLCAASASVAVVEAIKLLEADMHRHSDAIWLVLSSREAQVERLMASRGLTQAQAALRIDAQPPVADKVACADVVIDNSGTLEATWAQVVDAWRRIPGAPPPPATVWKPELRVEGRS